jgi:hypothetical protein
MGKILNGILGGVSGKVGGVIGASWKGIDYLKAYNIPANPQTVAQTAQRSIFSTCVWMAKLILSSIILDYWNPFAVQMSGFNSFMKRNLLLMTDDDDYESMLIAEGSLESDIISGVTYETATVQLNWSPTIQGNGLATDIAAAVVYDVVNHVCFVNDTTVARSAGGISVTVGSGRTAANLKAYLFFHRGSGETLEVSNSDYIQVTA